jgi:Mg2+ and Co2+ transporter CorA
MASMAGMQDSLDETKALKLLTVLGFVFVPCSTIASIFSMPDHAPTDEGGFSLFAKIAFSVSGVLTFLTCCVLWWSSIRVRLGRLVPA